MRGPSGADKVDVVRQDVQVLVEDDIVGEGLVGRRGSRSAHRGRGGGGNRSGVFVTATGAGSPGAEAFSSVMR